MVLFQTHGNKMPEVEELYKSISVTLFLLTGAYFIFLLPISLFSTCSPGYLYLREPLPRAIIASWFVLLLLYLLKQNKFLKQTPLFFFLILLYILLFSFSHSLHFIRYWWLYGINFIIYLATNARIRQAYKLFLKDFYEFMNKRRFKMDTQQMELSTSQFWGRLRSVQNPN